mgnify:CR=1 FL=1
MSKTIKIELERDKIREAREERKAEAGRREEKEGTTEG